MKFKQRIGVPVEGKVRVQLNLKVQQAPNIKSVAQFRDFVFPIMWLEEVCNGIYILDADETSSS
jgi:hypothetical protein